MVIGSEAVEGHDHSDPARHADGTAHDPEEDSELHDQSDPAQHADCAAHDADEDSEAVAAGEADCVDTDEAAMPMGGVATGAGGISGGGSAPVLVAVGLILSVSGLIGLRRRLR